MTTLPKIKFNERFRIALMSGVRNASTDLRGDRCFYTPKPFDVVVNLGGSRSFNAFELEFMSSDVECIMQIALFACDVRSHKWRMYIGDKAKIFRVIRFKNLESALLFKLSYVE